MTSKLLIELAQAINQLEVETKEFLNEFHTLIASEKSKHSDMTSCFFTQSFLLNKDVADKQMMVGSFSIKNNSNHPLTSPVILIKVKSDTAIDFSGKFAHAKQTGKNHNFSWERLEGEEEGAQMDFWLKPIRVEKISPGEVLTFKNFQIGFSLLESNNILIEGFAYFAEKKSGVSSLNTININC
ncbi:hypothetical protein F9802_13045 [Bacillus aerolatus]|uniref:Uncharacterized protein n=1 Tax=Bacillus aerolatus TaxID=2653354 RepID=A0A6I1FJG3_9BACI|nr:hypothetical protein [Bacillus aerolatus]KAB7705986.1 hypothetical protein F9802_13045 [Bacillus aerolatus]